MGTYTKIWTGSALTLAAVGAVTGLVFDPGTAIVMLLLGLVTGAAVGIIAERGRLTTWGVSGALLTVGTVGLAQWDGEEAADGHQFDGRGDTQATPLRGRTDR